MLPTYDPGDLAVAIRPKSPDVGDVIVYRIPAGQAGAGKRVIHRIVGGNGTDGFITQGDNQPYLDPWRPTSGDVIGTVVLDVPRLGLLMLWLISPGNLALIAVGSFAWALWPRSRSEVT